MQLDREQMNLVLLPELNPELEKYQDRMVYESYRRWKNGRLPRFVYFLLQAPEVARAIANVAEKLDEYQRQQESA